jgi:hypothetical protein
VQEIENEQTDSFFRLLGFESYMYSMDSIIDDSGRIPTLKNRRVNILDVMATIRINSDPEYQFKQVWSLSEDEIEEVTEYIRENRDVLEDLQYHISQEHSFDS